MDGWMDLQSKKIKFLSSEITIVSNAMLMRLCFTFFNEFRLFKLGTWSTGLSE